MGFSISHPKKSDAVTLDVHKRDCLIKADILDHERGRLRRRKAERLEDKKYFTLLQRICFTTEG